MIALRACVLVTLVACASDPPAIAPNGAGTESEIPPSPTAESASQVDLKRECVTGGAEDVKGAMKITCAPASDCLVWQGRCYYKKKSAD